MGGKAFSNTTSPTSSPPLKTPRMTPQTYTHLKTTHLALLKTHFTNGRVETLIEAPSKTSYGDIDFVATAEKASDFQDIANGIGAAGLIVHSKTFCSLAVAVDGERCSHSAVVYTMCKQAASASPSPPPGPEERVYAQLDLELIPEEVLDWHIFQSSYGGLGRLIGRIVKILGFAFRADGFYLRMKELDESKGRTYHNLSDKEGIILLSRNPKALMEFLGLDVAKYDAGFDSLEELYAWLGECRLLETGIVARQWRMSKGERKNAVRPLYADFFDEWLPAKAGTAEAADDEQISRRRDELAREAVVHFGKEEEYRTKHDAVLRIMKNAIASDLLRPIVAQHSELKEKKLAEVMKALRRYMGVDDSGEMSIRNEPCADEDTTIHLLLNDKWSGFKKRRDVDCWVKNNWKGIKALERARREGEKEDRDMCLVER